MNDAEKAAWLDARCGKLTASRMAEAMSFKKDGKPSAERDKLMKELLAERLTGLSVRHFVSSAMEWGLLQEPEAKMAYEVATGNVLQDAGYYDHPSIDMCGATPDALIGRDGLAEFKAPTTVTHIGWMLDGKVPDCHIPQMALQLACTGRRWCEFVSYDPRVKIEAQRLFIRRYEPTSEEIAAVEAAAVKFLDELERAWELLTTAAA